MTKFLAQQELRGWRKGFFFALAIIATLAAGFGFQNAIFGVPEFNVLAYGAIPNDGVSDVAAFQKCFNDAAARTPSKIVIPGGTWTIDEKITLASANDIDIFAYGAKIQATVRICPWWFAWQNCNNIHWYGGHFVGVENTSTCYDRNISLEGINRTITAIGTDEMVSVATVNGSETCYEHGLEVGDTVTISGSNSTPSADGTWTVASLDPLNPRGKFKLSGIDITNAGTTGTIVGYGEPAILACTTGNPSSSPVVTVDTTANLLEGGTYYFQHTEAEYGSVGPNPPISLDGNGGSVGTRSAIDGLRTVHIIDGTHLSFTDTAATDIPTVTGAQVSAGGKIQHGVDDSPGVDASVGNRRLGDLEGSRVFWFTSGERHGIHDVTTAACDALLFNDTSGHWTISDCRHTGPFTEGWDTGLRTATHNDHKQTVLPYYWIQIEGGYDWLIKDCHVQYATGAVVGGAGNPYKSEEQDQIHANAVMQNLTCEWFFDNGVYLTGRQCRVIGGSYKYGIAAGVGCKFRGFGHSCRNVTVEGVDNGFGLEGTLSEATMDDPWGNGGAHLAITDCIARNCTTAGVWTDDNAGLWPRDLRVVGCFFINCGSVSTTLATQNRPAIQTYGDRETLPSAINSAPVKLLNCSRLEFRGNTIDDSESGGLLESASTSDGYVALKVSENQYTAHKLGFKCYITVAGHSVSAYNGTHFITATIGNPAATPGVSDGSVGQWLKTTTRYTSAGTGGYWTHPRAGYAAYFGNGGGASSNGRAANAGSIIKDNTIIGSKSGFYMSDVTDADVSGNRGFDIDRDTTVDDLPGALFNVASFRRSTFTNNSVHPLGNRLLFVESGGTYSGIDEEDNDGYIDTTKASATADPPLTNAVLWMDSDKIVDTTVGNSGDENVLKITGTNQIHADTWIAGLGADGNGIAAWLDSITRMRFTQDTAAKRPVYKMIAAVGGDAANLLNGHAVVRFDGSDDLLRMKGGISYAQTGTIYLVVKPTSDAVTTRVLFSSSDETTTTTYFRVERNASNGRVQVRCRNGSGDTETLVQSASNALPINTWKVVRIRSDGTNITIAVSNGSGAMATSTGSVTGTDGRWFGDIDGSLYRDSAFIGGERRTSTEQTWFAGDYACMLIYEGDVSALHSAIEAHLFAKYGSSL